MKRMYRSGPFATAVVWMLWWAVSAGAQEITTAHLVDGLKDPDRWLTYSGDYTGRRHSPLTDVGPQNVHQLAVQWIFQTGSPGRLQATPLVIDGILYVSGHDNQVWAIDGRTGRVIWQFKRVLPDRLVLCCGRVNRGLAAYGSRLYLATLDARLVALDRATGSIVWESVIADPNDGYSATVAPLIVKDKVIVGIAGAEFGVRGFIDAYDVHTGKRAWRFWTIPGPGEPGHETWLGDSWTRGGGSTWLTGTYDPELNLLYWGTGNPAPDSYGAVRKGDNLYTDSVVALDPDSGKLRWHYQFTPHDIHDWDAVQVPVLADLVMGGERRKTILLANRNGFFYVLDRTNGTLIRARPFVHTTWARRIGEDGRPVLLANNEIQPGGTVTCPDVEGATNWMSPSFNPATGLLYVTTREVCAKYYVWPQEFMKGRVYWGGATETVPGEPGYGALRALDPLTGVARWEFRYVKPGMGGTLTTASGLVFAGEQDGNLLAVDARTGKPLWHFQTGAAVTAAPMTYARGGRQYVIVASGTNLIALALP